MRSITLLPEAQQRANEEGRAFYIVEWREDATVKDKYLILDSEGYTPRKRPKHVISKIVFPEVTA